MIDHGKARALAAAAIDGTLSGGESASLQEHLEACPPCRAAAAGLRHDAAALRRLDFGDAPARLRQRIADAAAVSPGSQPAGARSLVFVLALLLLLAAAAGTIAVGAQQLLRREAPLLAAADAPIHWQTEVVELAAEGLVIETGGRRFTAFAPVDVRSDRGDASSWTLELTWREHGVEMRMNVYFAADGSTWSIREIRTYDGQADGDWLFYLAPEVRAPLGQPWIGGLDLRSVDASRPGRGPGRLVVDGLRLAVAPGRGGGPAIGLPNIDLGLEPVAGPIGPTGELACTGIERLDPRRAEIRLRELGYHVEWHLQTTTGPNQGTTERRDAAPDGVITTWVSLGEKKVAIYVAPAGDPQAVPMPHDPACPPEPVDEEAGRKAP